MKVWSVIMIEWAPPLLLKGENALISARNNSRNQVKNFLLLCEMFTTIFGYLIQIWVIGNQKENLKISKIF